MTYGQDALRLLNRYDAHYLVRLAALYQRPV